MAKRAAICVGVNRAGSMTPLQAAIHGAQDFEAWAKTQGCDTTLLVGDTNGRVGVAEIFDAVEKIVNAQIYGQLIIYFSGHGVLTAPGTEYWLLSRAPDNPNEAVNLSLSVTYAGNCGIPHVVFVSDACRSSVTGPPLSGVKGGVIFPSRPFVTQQAEVEVYYATRPGDPAYEVPEAEATQKYRNIFTDALLRVVKSPPASMVDSVESDGTSKKVITSRKLKDHLEATVPLEVEDINLQLRQAPWLDVRTALPKYFAEVSAASVVASPSPEPPLPPTVDHVLSAISKGDFLPESGGLAPDPFAVFAEKTGLAQEVQGIAATRGRSHFETMTGFTVFGAGFGRLTVEAQRWAADAPFSATDDMPDTLKDPAWHVRLKLRPGEDQRKPSTIVFGFGAGNGAALAILPGFIGTVIVTNGRVTSVSYVPSDQTSRYRDYQKNEKELTAMKAYAAVASRNGRFVVEDQNAHDFAGRIRQSKGIDPTMGLYAAYAYAQAGAYEDVYSVYSYMRNDEIELPIPFDVGLLATRFKADAIKEPYARFAPFCPMLAQGWAFLQAGGPMHQSIHDELRPYLVPSLWTTLSPDGVGIAREAIKSGRLQ